MDLFSTRYKRIPGGSYLKLLLLSLVMVSSCQLREHPPFANQPPNTWIVNVPSTGDTLSSPILTLSWNGGDPDGYIKGYEYRVVTYHIIKRDSVVQNWQFTTETSMTIVFNSTDMMNEQIFYVRAVDNDGAVDPTPAQKIVFTKQAIPPSVSIYSPTSTQEYFALDHITDWWPGILLTYNGKATNGVIQKYGWAVDGGGWNWTQDTSAYITPGDFSGPIGGKHTVKVTAVDGANLMAPPESVTVDLIQPSFQKTILVVNETNASNFPSAVGATQANVDSFYAATFGQADPSMWGMWDYLKQGAPPKSVLGQYHVVAWVADDKPTGAPHALPANISEVEDYLNVGGNLIVSGWRVIKSFAWKDNFPVTFGPGTFVNDYLQIDEVDETPPLANMTHCLGIPPFTDIQVDSAKLNFFPDDGALNNVNIVLKQGGFTEPILSYGTTPNTSYPKYRGAPVGLIYYGTSYNVAVLGFPIFFIRQNDARNLLQEILQRFGY